MLPLDDSLLVEDQLVEQVNFPAFGSETMEWSIGYRVITGDANFGLPSISDDRRSVTLIWFGTPSARLEELVGEARADLTVVIQSALFRTAELNEFTEMAVTTKGDGARRASRNGRPRSGRFRDHDWNCRSSS